MNTSEVESNKGKVEGDILFEFLSDIWVMILFRWLNSFLWLLVLTMKNYGFILEININFSR